MLIAIHRTLISIFYILLLLCALIAVWSIADQEFREKLSEISDPYIKSWVSEQSIVTDLQGTLDDNRVAIARLETENADLKQQLEKLSSDLEHAASLVEQERNQLSSEFSRLKSELDKEASSREIAIEQVRDKFTVIRVGDKILFDTGSSQLKPRGREVLGLIANTLGKFPDRQVRVEGHTDNKPIVSPAIKRRYPSNWELSSARATAAVRFLIEGGGLDPARVIAVGLGEYHPIASNDSTQDRARNRRIEIVLMPAQDNYRTQEIEGL
ncbi:MAG: OmpA family protein [Gammaproteobacteria bacterium]|nr:OmpA family protein [Gammaproteobacteria bacterium]